MLHKVVKAVSLMGHSEMDKRNLKTEQILNDPTGKILAAPECLTPVRNPEPTGLNKLSFLFPSAPLELPMGPY